jgi:hypothetical protein
MTLKTSDTAVHALPSYRRQRRVIEEEAHDMGLRKVLFIIGGATFACLLICVVVLFIGLRAARNSVHDDVAHAISSAVAQEISAAPRTSAPMTLDLSAADIAEQIALQYNDNDIDADNLVVRFSGPDQITVGLDTSGQDITYTATLSAEDGQLVVSNVDGNIRAVTFLLPGGRLGDAIEEGVNDALFAQNLSLESVDVLLDRLRLVVVNGETAS